ncbi:MAG: hypothetical protein [Bacteriophage sp.]|nr:MAG: hypothetical protein [Bacteriophage sp.]
MSLLKKKLDITVEGEEYIMMFDMKSIAVYQELSNVSFAEGFLKLQLFDDIEAINFIASTLRKNLILKNHSEKILLKMEIYYLL